MPKFTVHVVRTVTSIADIEVSAADEDAAERKVAEMIDGVDDDPRSKLTHAEWEIDATDYEIESIDDC
jgi:hypothetical protein